MRYAHRSFLLVLLAVACARQTERLPAGDGAAQSGLAGTKWTLVKFTGLSNADVIVPPAVNNYTIVFSTDGKVAVQADCDRGMGTWSASEGSTLRFSQLAVTTVGACQPGSIAEKFFGDLQRVNSWAVANDRLYISLRAKAGTYELQPTD